MATNFPVKNILLCSQIRASSIKKKILSLILYNRMGQFQKHRHILNIARALKIQSNVPKNFLLECILTTIYLINRLPIEEFGQQSPYERLCRYSSQYAHLRKLGCLYYATRIGKHKDKFNTRAIKAILVSYVWSHKAYKLYSLVDGSLFGSRDVVFHEKIFSFKENVALEQTTLLLPIINLDPQLFITISPASNHDDLPLPRRSARTKHPPTWMQDYVGSSSPSSSSFSFCLSCTNYIYNVSKVPNPCIYAQASLHKSQCFGDRGPRKTSWISVVQQSGNQMDISIYQ